MPHPAGSPPVPSSADAVSALRAGRGGDAERLSHAVLANGPADPDALQVAGLVAFQRRDFARGRTLLERAFALRPDAACALNLGAVRMAQGDFATAADIFRAAAARVPTMLEAWLNLGLAQGAMGRTTAVDALRRAVALAPDTAAPLLALGMALRALGRPGTVPTPLRWAVMADPRLPSAHSTLATARYEAGESAGAAAAARAALAMQPDSAEVLSNLCVLLGPAEDGAGGRAAERAARRALRLDPGHGGALCNLGAALTAGERPEEADPLLRRAAALRPDLPDAWGNLGAALIGRRRAREAAVALRRALRLVPAHAGNRCNLAAALLAEDRPDAAAAMARSAVAVAPAHPNALSNLGSACQTLGRPADAIRVLRRAVAADPGFVDARWNLALPLLQTGRLEEGWEAYEWRWHRRGFGASELNPPLPRWTGEPLEGRRILLYGEQGLGDTIQFARYIPMVAQRGATVHLQVQRPLLRLFEGLAGASALSGTDAPSPAADFCCPLMSLPRLFATRLDTVPGTFPYLAADPRAVAVWRRRLGPSDGRLRVGLVWSGNPRYEMDRLRSVAPGRLTRLLRVPGVRFFSLQKDRRSGDGAELEGLIEDIAPFLDDFSDTAAALTALDLLITVDTSAAHLGGALGRPVWTLLREPSDWRWLTETGSSPWYPGMRLFRQERPRDWERVLERVEEDLRRAAAGERGLLRSW
ncbi:tetratricopeptide repeat protein [Azospirillum formosense]|uniref:tetratricopeptide repeat protein n=1 Tax=Azospirillum formosense TaxID=861533 RepID=UPI00338E9432